VEKVDRVKRRYSKSSVDKSTTTVAMTTAAPAIGETGGRRERRR
jgi:hypothetical protein